MNTKPNTFRLGICMAGAISAGAYTAGVMDYLLEALENWEKAKQHNLPNIPMHNVMIEALTGASAGGMTAAITAAALQKSFPHINQSNYQQDVTKENPIYNAWVNLTEEEKDDMMNQMLNTDDILNALGINPHKEVRSGFNTAFIDKISERTLSNVVKDPEVKRSYCAEDMEFLTTLTNLRGFHFDVKFATALGKSEHRMTMHRDFAHFQINEAGVYNNDGKIPLHFNDANGLNKDLLADAAMSTGAFPIGLKPRIFKRNPKYINDNRLLRIDHHKKEPLVDTNNDHVNVNVDGGVINNQPFELTDQILIERRKQEIEKDILVQGGSIDVAKAEAAKYRQEISASKMDTTVIMVDPFPNYNEKPGSNFFPLLALKFSSIQLIGAMKEQLRLKVEEIGKAFDENNYSRFMIAPIRTKGGKTQNYSIACGSLGGFGGFFSKKFREHDFMLGRRNCQRFLQKFLSIPDDAKNPIIEAGYKDIKLHFLINEKFLPIIPDIRVKKADDGSYSWVMPDEEKEFSYPTIKLSYLLGLQKKIENRINVIIANFSNGKDPLKEDNKSEILKRIRKKGFFGRILNKIQDVAGTLYISIGVFFGKSIVAKLFIDEVITDMDKRNLIEDDMLMNSIS